MSDTLTRGLTLDQVLLQIGDGKITTADALKELLKASIDEAYSGLIKSIDELDKNTLVTNKDVLEITAKLQVYDDLIKRCEGIIADPTSSQNKLDAFASIKSKVADARANEFDRLSAIAVSRNMTIGHRVAEVVEAFFPNSAKMVVESAKELTNCALSFGVLVKDIVDIINQDGLLPESKATQVTHKLFETVVQEAAIHTEFFSKLIQNGIGTGVLSSKSFFAIISRATLVNLAASGAYYLAYEVAFRVFDYIGLYDSPTFINCSDVIYDVVTDANLEEQRAPITQVVGLFSLLDPKFNDVKLRAIMGSDRGHAWMDYGLALAAYKALCDAYGIEPGDCSTPERFMASTAANSKIFLKDLQLVGQLQFVTGFTAKEAISGPDGLAMRYALVHGMQFAIVGKDYSAYANELSVYSPQNPSGVLTESFINDRILMVQALGLHIQGKTFYTFDHFEDRQTGVTIIPDLNGEDEGSVPDYLSRKIIFGSDGDDGANNALEGGAGDDHIYGGGGNDVLIGGRGSNYLEGGNGNDKYYVLNDGKVDTIFDVDGDGELYIDGAKLSGPFTRDSGAHHDFYSADKYYKIVVVGDEAEVSVQTRNGYIPVAKIQNWQDGKFGIDLKTGPGGTGGSGDEQRVEIRYPNSIAYLNFNASSATQGVYMEAGSKSASFTGSGYSDIISIGNGLLSYVLAWGGDDYIIGGDGRSFIRAGANTTSLNISDNDVVWGGGNSDIIFGGAGEDILWGGSGGIDMYYETEESGERGDWIGGEYGDDTIYGSSSKDMLFGGAGNDRIFGGAGNDLILGDANYTSSSATIGLSYAAGSTISYVWRTNRGGFVRTDQFDYGLDAVTIPSGTIFEWDWSVTASDNFTISLPRPLTQERVMIMPGNDYLDGGLGDDFIAGQAGDDIVIGGDGDDILYGDDAVPLSRGEEGNDMIYAGFGKDRLYGGGGNDLLDASDDDNDLDLLYGGSGDDTLIGGTGHDRLYGEDGNDELHAGSDGSELYGGSGSDLLFGGDGNDRLEGGEGNDWLVGSRGADTLLGGAGADCFLFSLDDLQDAGTNSTIADASSEDRLYIGGTSLDSLAFVATSSNSWRSADGSVQLTLSGGLVIQSLDDDVASPGEVVVLGFRNGILGLELPVFGSDEPPPVTNHAPTVGATAINQTGRQNDVFIYTLPNSLFIDPDGDILTYSLTLADNSPLPSWLKFDPSSRTLSGTPGGGDVGNLSLKVIATDTFGASASQSFALTIDAIGNNHVPTVGGTVANQNATQGQAFSLVLPESLFSDPDGDVLTFSVVQTNGAALPPWLNFNVATRTLSGTPTNNDVGTLSLKVVATDPGGLLAAQTFSLQIANVNDAPQVAFALSSQQATEDQAFSLILPQSMFIDPDGDALTFSVTLGDGSALPSWLTYNATTRTLSGTPAAGSAGNLSLKVTATDAGGLSASQTFALAVAGVNHAPQVSSAISNQNAMQGQAFNLVLPASLFSDPDGDNLTFSVFQTSGLALPAWLTFNAATRTLSGTPAAGDIGILGLKVVATDPGGLSVYQNFNMQIEARSNLAPVIGTTIGNQNATQDQAFSLVLPASLFTDPDGDVLSFSVTLADGTALPSWLTYNAATRTLSGTPANGNVGSMSLKVTAIDTGGLSASQTFGLNIANVNDAPVVAGSIGNQNATQDQAFSLVLPASLFSDPDGDTLAFSVTRTDGLALPSWLTYNAATRTLSGTPANGDVGSLSLKVTATDPGGLSASQTFGLNIANVNDAPVVAGSIGNQNAAKGQPFSLVLPASLFTDPDNDALTFSVSLANGSPLPAWLTYNAATRTLSGTPAASDAGSFSIRVTASDPGGLSAAQTFALDVSSNRAPVINEQIEDFIIQPAQYKGESQSLPFEPWRYFKDPDGDALTYKLTMEDGSPLPPWIVDGGVGKIYATPEAVNAGLWNLKYTATDSSGASTSQSFSIRVNSAPKVTSALAQQRVTEGQYYNLQLPANLFTDADGETLTWTMKQADGKALPSWLVFDPVNKTLRGTAPVGTDVLSLNVTATDPYGQSAQFDFGLLVGGYAPLHPGVPTLQVGTSWTGGAYGEIVDSLYPGTILYGMGGNDRMTVLRGTVYGGDGDDWIKGGAGSTLYGDAGADTIHVTSGKAYGGIGNDNVTGVRSTIYGDLGDDVLTINIAGGAYGGDGNDRIYLRGGGGEYDSQLGDGGNGNDYIEAYGGYVNLFGQAGNDTLISYSSSGSISGGDGDDILINYGGCAMGGGKGNDALYSYNATRNDGYTIYSGEGRDTIYDAGGSADSMYLGQINYDQLWFRRQGNDLVIDRIGTTDSVTVQAWYADNGAHQIETIYAGGNRTMAIANSQVDLLVQAMASFAPPVPGQTTLPPAYQSALGSVMASSWK